MQRNTLIIIFVLLLMLSMGLSCQDKTPKDQQKEQIKIGVVLPLTGPTAKYGQWVKNAIELALENYNSADSSKYHAKYVIEDDGGESKNAVTATQKLITVDQVPVIFGTWSSSGVMAMGPVIDEARVVLMADAVSPKIRELGNWVFRCVPDARLSLQALKEPVEKSEHKRLAISYINNDFGKDLADFLQSLFRQDEPKIVFKEGYAAGTTDFRTHIEKIKRANPDSWFIAGYTEQGTLMRQAKELGLVVQMYASPSFENQDILARAGDAANSVIYPFYFDSNSEIKEMRDFTSEYFRTYNEPAEGFGAAGFAGMQAIFMAIDHAHTYTSENIRQALRDLGNFRTVFGETFIDEVGDLRYPIFLKTAQNGIFVRKTN